MSILDVMELPCDGVEESDQAGLGDAAFKERIGGQSPEGVIADFRIGRGSASMNEREIFVGRDGGDFEKGQPKVDSVS